MGGQGFTREMMPRPGRCPGWQPASQGYEFQGWREEEEEEETYFALYLFKGIKVHGGVEPLYSTGCRMFALTEDPKDSHLEKSASLGSAPLQSQ